MAAYTITRYEVRPDAHTDAERAMREYADYVRQELPDSSWTAYRDPHAPTHYTAVVRVDGPVAEQRHRDAPGTQAFIAALAPLLVGAPERTECELVTSSDLGRRPPAPRRSRR